MTPYKGSADNESHEAREPVIRFVRIHLSEELIGELLQMEEVFIWWLGVKK
jgi:hypothetical protein